MKKTIASLSAAVLAAGSCLAGSFTPGNLAVLSADSSSANNTTCTILELAPSTASQTVAVSSTAISGSGPNALRISGKASTTGYLARNADRSLLAFTGVNTNDTATNVNSLNPRAVGTLDVNRSFLLQTVYNGSNNCQTRCATSLDNATWVIGDQGGIYTNGATAPSPGGNFRGVKSFGGSIYVFQASTSAAPVSALSGGTLTGLPGLPFGATAMQDFYMIASGSNGVAYDILYVLQATTDNAGAIRKYSLVGGSWMANGSNTTAFGGFGLAATANGDGTASLYVTSGAGALVTNTVRKLTDTAGYNATIALGAPTTLYTAAAGTTLKGIDFVPVAVAQAPTVWITGAAAVQWSSVTGAYYRLERSTNLCATPAFNTTVQTNISANPPKNTATDTNATGAGPYFYRVGVE